MSVAGAAGASPESVDRVDRRQVCLATQEKGTAAKDAWMGTATHGEVGATAMGAKWGPQNPEATAIRRQHVADSTSRPSGTDLRNAGKSA